MASNNIHLITRDEILDAIKRVHATDTYNPQAIVEPEDGTYKLIASWIGSQRVWFAQKLSNEGGYEIAVGAIPDKAWYPLSEARFGVWTDPETGEIDLDQTVNIRGSFNTACEMASFYNQKAFWSWIDNRVWPM
jgi:hypothetical protein